MGLQADTSDLNDYLRDLRRAGSDLPKKVQEAEKTVVGEVAEWGKDDLASAGHPTQRHVARLRAIRAKVTGRTAALRIDAKAKRNAMSLGATIGSKQFRQFPDYRDPGRGWPTPRSHPPFSTVAEREDDIRDMYFDAAEEALSDAYPDE